MDQPGSSAPNGEQEALWFPLAETDPALAAKLTHRYAQRFIVEAGLSAEHLQTAIETVELRLGPVDPDGEREIRVRSVMTGTTYWFGPWDGEVAKAEEFIDAAVDLQGGNIHDERAHGPLPWDS
jgi:hypothetical protein